MTLRLAIVRQKYRPDGGAERFISRALRALQRHQSLDLNVITRQWQGDADPAWHIHLCDPPKWGRISREKGFARAARQCWQALDIDLVQSHERIAGCDIYRAGDGVHRRWLQYRSQGLSRWRREWLWRSPYHRYVMQAEREMFQSPALKAVICNSQMVKREIMEDFQLPEHKIAVIYNAIDAQRFTPGTPQQRQQLCQQLDIPESACLFIFVGSGFARKGLADALRALASTDSYLLVVGQDKNWKHYQTLARTLGCERRVRFVGMQKAMLSWYQSVDALLLPTHYDPFPNVILEALACGLPVITTQQCGGAEFIETAQNGYVCPARDSKTLTEAIQAIATQRHQHDFTEAARASVLHATPERLSAELMALYQRLTAKTCVS